MMSPFLLFKSLFSYGSPMVPYVFLCFNGRSRPPPLGRWLETPRPRAEFHHPSCARHRRRVAVHSPGGAAGHGRMMD